VAAAPIAAPATPPSAESSSDSTRNWSPTCHLLAPSARRKPISARRSSTEITMMLPMPTPPTSTATAPRPRNRPVKAVRAAARAARMLDGRLTCTASGWAGFAVNGRTLATGCTWSGTARR
jgi:hypothetical protein